MTSYVLMLQHLHQLEQSDMMGDDVNLNRPEYKVTVNGSEPMVTRIGALCLILFTDFLLFRDFWLV